MSWLIGKYTQSQTKLRQAHAFFYLLITVSDFADTCMNTFLDSQGCGFPAALWQLSHFRPCARYGWDRVNFLQPGL